MVKKLNINKGLLIGLIAPVITFTGCGKSDCDMKEYHLHKYEKDGFIRYIDDEHLNNSGYNWTDEIVYVKESDRELYEFEKKKDLFKIDDNKDVLINTVSNMDDYVEYEYSYLVPHHMRSGKVSYTYYTTSHAWTTDSEHGSLTGDVRLCRYTYTGYKINLNDKGKYELVAGDTYENLENVILNSDEYPYMKVDFYDTKVVCDGKIDETGNPYFPDVEKTYIKK